MSTFKFKSGVKTLDITDDAGTVIKTYRINVGEKEAMKKWTAKLSEIQETAEKLENDSRIYDELEKMMRDIVQTIVGDWDYLWDLAEHNVFSMLGFVRHLSVFINDEMKKFYEDYV